MTVEEARELLPYLERARFLVEVDCFPVKGNAWHTIAPYFTEESAQAALAAWDSWGWSNGLARCGRLRVQLHRCFLYCGGRKADVSLEGSGQLAWRVRGSKVRSREWTTKIVRQWVGQPSPAAVREVEEIMRRRSRVAQAG